MEAADRTRALRLNPFAFPAETDVRFLMLIGAAIALSVLVSNPLRYAVWPGAENPFSEPIKSPDMELDDDAYYRQLQEESSQTADDALRALLMYTGLIIALVAVAWIIYRRHPGRIRRKFHLAMLAIDQDPKLQQEVQSLAATAGIAPPPRIELEQGLRSSGGQAFGFRNSYSLRLGGGLRVLLRKAPDQFRAIVLHELGHIANRDIGRTYFAQAMWVAFTLLILLPLILALLVLLLRRHAAEFDLHQLLTVNLPPALSMLLKTSGILALAATIRASLLRAREFYADWRAASWGAKEALADLIRLNLENSRTWKFNPWRLHPTPQERLNNLQKPGWLFRTSVELPLLSGMLLGFVLEGTLNATLHLAMALGSLSSAFGADAAQHGLLGSAWILVGASLVVAILSIAAGFFFVGWLISGTVGLQVQRAAVAESSTGVSGRGYMGLCWLAALSALGMEISLFITPAGIFGAQHMDSILEVIPWLLVWTAMFWLSLIFARFHSIRVLGSHAGKTPPMLRRRALTFLMSALICVGLVPVLISRFLQLHANTTEDQMLWLKVIGIGIPVWLLLYGLMWSFCWLGWKAMLTIARRRCSNCNHPIRHTLAVAHQCESCHAELAGWLFVNYDIDATSH